MQQVKLALAEAEANVASLRFALGDMQARLEQLRASASRVPQIEAELAQLNRDYEKVRRNYEAMVARREKAALSEDVDATRRAVPIHRSAPRQPSSRCFRIVGRWRLGLLVAWLAGVGAAFLAARLMPTFDSAKRCAR